MGQHGLQTRELDDSSATSPPPSLPPSTRRPAAAAAITALLVMALGATILALVSAPRPPRSVTGAVMATPLVALSPTMPVSPLRPPQHGAGLPEGEEVIAYMPTGPD
jgi:hypothetical protein